MEIDGEDSSLGDIVHHELLKEKNVIFAAAISPHPLLRKLKLRVETSNGKTVQSLISSTERARDNLQEIAEALKKSIKNHR